MVSISTNDRRPLSLFLLVVIYSLSLGLGKLDILSILIGTLIPLLIINAFTVSIETSTGSMSKNHPLQNQSKSTALASSMLLKKSAGSGCLKAHRVQ